MEPVCNERAENCGCECECDTCREPVVMNARVLRGGCCELLVCDLCACQEVLVHTANACCFQPGQCVRIEYDGAMTMSIPPQISASCVTLMNGCCCC